MSRSKGRARAQFIAPAHRADFFMELKDWQGGSPIFAREIERPNFARSEVGKVLRPDANLRLPLPDVQSLHHLQVDVCTTIEVQTCGGPAAWSRLRSRFGHVFRHGYQSALFLVNRLAGW
jgi:hypothetical protein